MPPVQILLATNNTHKMLEIARALGPDVDLIRPDDVGSEPPKPDENGATYLENALIKARAFSLWSGIPSLADDSGLEVAALGGAPGLHSARFAGSEASEADNRQLLLRRLAESGSSDRSARFICALAWVDGNRVLSEITGECPGRIAESDRGAGGFGYDPIFIPHGESRSFAEMSSEEKDRQSHRGRALLELSRHLDAIGGFDA